VLERRADVQQAFARPGGGVDRLEFVRWLSHDGIVHHKLKPAWAAAWLAEVEDVGVMRSLLDFYDGDAELRRLFPQAFVEEHDADAFLAWLEAHAVARGFPASSLAAARRLFASRPSDRIRAIYASRPDVQGAYPDALASPPASGFLGWLHVSGHAEHGLSEDSVLWFERAALQHACRRLDAAWHERAEWRARQPLAQTVFGRAAFLDWLRAEHAELVPEGLERLCAATGLAPVEELRIFHREDAEAQTRGPRAFEDPDDTDALLEVVRGRAAALGLSSDWIEEARRALPPMALREGATIVGYLRTESGMGELSRSTARALKAAGYPITTHDVDDAPQRQFDLSLAHEDRGHPLPYTVVHLNAPEAVRHARALEPLLRDRHAIGYWAWELAELPDDWTEAFGLFREVWTCSIHAAGAIGRRAPVPVQAIWPALPDTAPSALTRDDFGLPADRFTFLFLYDLLSESARKNPHGLLEAFRRAFRADDRVQLVIKTSNGDLRRDDWKRLAAAAEGLPVTLFDRYLSRADVLALVRSCDAYASLHRAEGFGYTMAEAMALGRPVIATHYSGNADFMTPWNSFPVPYGLIELDETHGRYARVGLELQRVRVDVQRLDHRLGLPLRHHVHHARVGDVGRGAVRRRVLSEAARDVGGVHLALQPAAAALRLVRGAVRVGHHVDPADPQAGEPPARVHRHAHSRVREVDAVEPAAPRHAVLDATAHLPHPSVHAALADPSGGDVRGGEVEVPHVDGAGRRELAHRAPGEVDRRRLAHVLRGPGVRRDLHVQRTQLVRLRKIADAQGRALGHRDPQATVLAPRARSGLHLGRRLELRAGQHLGDRGREAGDVLVGAALALHLEDRDAIADAGLLRLGLECRGRRQRGRDGQHEVPCAHRRHRSSSGGRVSSRSGRGRT
jgi:glycosyltransferase involved in cell wall biosynthesis